MYSWISGIELEEYIKIDENVEIKCTSKDIKAHVQKYQERN